MIIIAVVWLACGILSSVLWIRHTKTISLFDLLLFVPMLVIGGALSLIVEYIYH